jgi:hypothetical protein
VGSFSRTKSSIAAVAATALMLSGMTPAVAAEQAAAVTDVSAKRAPIKHLRMASVRPVRHVAAVTPLQRNLGCSGEWCGRQFVLIIGIGF